MPSTRARLWSMASVITFDGSSQSKLTSRVHWLARISAATWLAISRIFCLSSPTTRNCTGKPTGGPFSRRFTRPRTSGKSWSKSFSRCARTISRSSLLFVFTMNWPKFAFTSCWSKGR
jgi:hypothetical protein